MLFGKLLPREGNFFEMFNQHADRIVEAAHGFFAAGGELQRRRSCATSTTRTSTTPSELPTV